MNYYLSRNYNDAIVVSNGGINLYSLANSLNKFEHNVNKVIILLHPTVEL